MLCSKKYKMKKEVQYNMDTTDYAMPRVSTKGRLNRN